MSAGEHDRRTDGQVQHALHSVGVVGRFRAGVGGGRYSETNMMTGGWGQFYSLDPLLCAVPRTSLSLKKGSVGGTHHCKAFEVKREQTINFRKMLMLIQTTRAALLTDTKLSEEG